MHLHKLPHSACDVSDDYLNQFNTFRIDVLTEMLSSKMQDVQVGLLKNNLTGRVCDSMKKSFFCLKDLCMQCHRFQVLPYKFYVLGQIGLSKQCRPRSDCF